MFTPGLPAIPVNGITNAASRIVSALGSITFGGTITATDTITVTINSATYEYTVVNNDTLATVILNITNLINGVAKGKPGSERHRYGERGGQPNSVNRQSARSARQQRHVLRRGCGRFHHRHCH